METARAATPDLDRSDPLAVVRAHMEAEQRRDADAAAATFTDDCYYFVAPLGLRLEGREQIRDWYRSGFDAVPDYHDAEQTYWLFDGDGERFVLYQALMQGTHLGTWHGWRATGRTFSVPMLVRIPMAEDGLMKAEEVYFDASDVLGQLGIAPRHGSRGERVAQALHAARMRLTRR